MKYEVQPYHITAIRHQLNHDRCGVFLDMGLGKTAITLTAVKTLLWRLMVNKILIIAPKRVVESVWIQECEKWDHLNCLKGIRVIGNERQRIKALQSEADFYLISRDLVTWLIKYYKTAFPFDTVIIDELSSFKSSNSQRFRSLKMVITKARRVIGLTGTPVPNGMIDLWAQMFLIDNGERLGTTISDYRRTYFDIATQVGHVVYKYALKKGFDNIIYNKIRDICISMTTEDYLKLPLIIKNVIKINPGQVLMDLYEDFEEEQVLDILDKQITAVNAAVLTNKLLQFCNGAVYDENRNVNLIHDLKLEALENIIDEAQGQNILVAYSFQHDCDRIKNKFPQARQLKNSKDIDEWNAGKISLLLLHPASGGHGLNLQFGGHILVWFGLNWNLEFFDQLNKRLHRPGQEFNLIMHFILIKGTVDETVMKVLSEKGRKQKELIEAVKARVDKYLTLD